MDREFIKDLIQLKKDLKNLTIKDFLKATILVIMFYIMYLMLYAIAY